MGKVIIVISMSLDGFVTADNVRLEAPMGDGGERLHNWLMSGDERDRAVLTKGIGGLGAVITGRRNYDMSIQWWSADGPTGPARLPVFVVTHASPKEAPKGGVYTFVDSIEAALSQAQSVAGDKVVSVMGGADIAQQYINAGLVDEIQIHLVPVIFGSGTRLFEHLTLGHINLEIAEVIQAGAAIHMRFRIA